MVDSQMHVEGEARIRPYTWKAIAGIAASALGQIAAELRRIADALERESNARD